MNATWLQHYRDKLNDLGVRLHGDTITISEEAQSATTGQGAGEITNVPQHIGDMGTDEFLYDLNASLLENEEFMAEEIRDALARIRDGSFGICEACHKLIAEDRLEAIPYTRYCVSCAEQAGAGVPVNINTGRPGSPLFGRGRGDAAPPRFEPQPAPGSTAEGPR